MACKVKIKAINHLKKEGATEDSRRIKDYGKFNTLNKKLTNDAYVQYGIGDNRTMLFSTENKQIRLADGSYKTVIRAIPNERLFQLLEEMVDEQEEAEEAQEKTPMQLLEEEASEGDLSLSAKDVKALEFGDHVVNNSAGEYLLFSGSTKITYTVKEILDNLTNNFSFNPTAMKVIEAIKNKTDAKVIIRDASAKASSDTAMQVRNGKIEIFLDVLNTQPLDFIAYTFLHEAVHTATLNAYYNPSTIEHHMFKDLVDELYDKYGEEFDKYGIKSHGEFIADAMSDPAFQGRLREMEKGGLWSRFLNAIRRIFGLAKDPAIDRLINAVTSIENTNDSISNLVFEKKTKGETKHDYSTTRKQIDKVVEEIKRSIVESIDELKQRKDNTSGKSSESIGYLTKILENLREDIERYHRKNVIQAISHYVDFINSSMANLSENVLNNIDPNDLQAIKKVLTSHEAYILRYSVIKDVNRLLADLKTQDQDEVDKESIKLIQSDISSAVGLHDNINAEFTAWKNKIFTDRIKDIKYHPEVEAKHRERLSKEYKEREISEPKESWMSRMMTERDKEIIDKDIDQATSELINNPLMDIYTVSVWSNSPINLSSKLINILNLMLNEIETERIKEERLKDRQFKALYEKLVTSKNTTNPLKLYSNIMAKAKDGQYIILDDYNIEAYNILKVDIPALDKKYNEKAAAINEEIIKTEENSAERLKLAQKLRELSAERKIEKGKLRKKLYEKKGGKFKDKYRNKKKLTEAEKEVKEFFIDIIDTAHKNTFRPSSKSSKSLVKTLAKEGDNWVTFYELPRVTKSDLERGMTGDAKGIITERWKDLTEIRPDEFEYAKVKRNQAGDVITNLRIHYRDYQGTFPHSDQSLDLFSIIRLEYKNGNMFKIRKKYETDLKFLLDIARDKEYTPWEGTNKLINVFTKKDDIIKGRSSNTYKFMNNLLEKRFYDIMKRSHPKFSKVDLNKFVSWMNRNSSFLALSLNYASATANVVNGSTQIFLETFLKGMRLNAQGIAKANKIYTQNMSETLKDVTAPINSSIPNQITEMFNARGIFNLSNANFLTSTFLKKGLTRQSLQVFQESGEHWLQSVIIMGTLEKIKVLNGKNQYIDANGKVVDNKKNAASLLDMLKKDENGVVQLDKNVVYTTHSLASKWNEGGREKVGLLIRKNLYDMVGNYSEIDQPEITRTTAGPLFYLYRKYLVPMGVARFRGFPFSYKSKEDLEAHERTFSYALGEYEEGSYTTLVRYVIQSIKDKKFYLLSKSNWNELSEYEKHNIKKALTEFTFMFVLLPLAHTFVAAAASGPSSLNDDDNEYLFFLAYQLRRLDSELSQYHHPTELFKLMRSPIPSVRLLETSLDIFGTVFNPAEWDEVYQQGENKGENKLKVKAMKELPVLKEFERNFEDLYEYQKASFLK